MNLCKNKEMKKEIAWLLKEKYFDKPNKNFDKDIKRLQAGEPLAYVIGFSEFLGCKIDLSKKPLIPRPETEFWVEKAISKMHYDSESFGDYGVKVLDIFSGSGCIGLAVLKNIQNATVVFAEKDKKNIDQIKLNCKINGLDKKRYKVIQSDIFDKVKGKFDYIFANPPYIALTKKSKIPVSVLDYEPHVALFGGEDGLFYIKNFLAGAVDFLNSGGVIFMEFDSTQKKSIQALLKKLSYENWQFYQDQYQRWRWVMLQNKI